MGYEIRNSKSEDGKEDIHVMDRNKELLKKLGAMCLGIYVMTLTLMILT